MSSIADLYTDEVHDNLKPFYANWMPDQAIALGDYGILNDGIFTHLGNVSQWGVKGIVDSPQSGTDQIQFASKGAASVTFNAAGSVAVGGVLNTKPSLKIDFSSERGVFFNAAACKHHMVDDKNALAAAIMHLYRDGKGKWKRDWVVVTDFIEARAATIMVSGGSSASIELEATADVPKIDLANASLGLAIKSSTNIGYQLIKQADDATLKPLIGFSKIQSKWFFSSDDFKPLALGMDKAAIITALEAEDDFQTERDPEQDLYFGQLKT